MPARRTTSTAKPSNVTDLERVQFNLDEWDDPTRVKEQFSAVVGGRRVVLIDPRDLDWQVVRMIDQAGDPMLFFDHCFREGDKEYFMEQKVESRKMNKLMELYFRHYNIDLGSGNVSASST